MKLNDFKQFNESAMTCAECGGPAFSDLILAEKQDACYHKVKSRYKVWPSAYASGALVQCRKKGAANWGNKSESISEAQTQGEATLAKIAVSGDDGYEMIYDGLNGLLGTESQLMLQDMYDNVSRQHRLHPDDNAEEIVDRMMDNIEADYGTQGVAEGSLEEVSVDLAKRARDKAERHVDWDEDDMRDRPEGYSEKQRSRFQRYIDRKEPRAPGDRDWDPAMTGMAEDLNPEYNDEAGMADNNLETLARAVDGIDDLIQSGDNLPEWCQEKIAVAKSMLVAVWDYMYSEEASDEVDPEIDAMFEAMDSLVEEIAARDNIDVDLVWESFESLDDHMLYETAAWRRKEGKSKSGGLNRKGVASYRRENPGSKLQMAVTTKPSKLKPGSKAAKRRKSFCARMSGVKGPMKKPNGKPTRKALALRKWNC